MLNENVKNDVKNISCTHAKIYFIYIYIYLLSTGSKICYSLDFNHHLIYLFGTSISYSETESLFNPIEHRIF